MDSATTLRTKNISSSFSAGVSFSGLILLLFLVPGSINLSVITGMTDMKEKVGIDLNGIRLVAFCFFALALFFQKNTLPKSFAVYAVFLVYCLFSLTYTPDFLEGIRFWAKLLVPLLVFSLTCNLSLSALEKLNKGFMIVILIHFPFVLSTLFEWFKPFRGEHEVIRAGGLSGGRVIFGTFMLLMVLLLDIRNSFAPRNGTSIKPWFILLPLMGVILSGARVAWIGLFFILFLSHPFRFLKKKILIFFLILLTIWLFFPLIEHRVGLRFEGGKLVLGGAGGGTAQDRLEAWGWLLKNPIPKNLWLGHGLGSSSVILKNLPPQLAGAFDYPHNEYLRILLENGIVGLSLFVCSWVYMGWYLFSTYKKWVFVLPIAIFAVFCFGDNTLNNYFENGGVLAYILAYLNKLDNSSKSLNV